MAKVPNSWREPGARSGSFNSMSSLNQPRQTRSRFFGRMPWGIVIGPATPEWLARVGDGEQAAFWIVATFQGLDRWIRSDRLRSKHAFDTQRSVQVIELVREAR